jgi:predicted Zn finger-like uncharacterized protein
VAVAAISPRFSLASRGRLEYAVSERFAMEVSCTSCPARFAVPDDKVRGRRVKMKCKRCGAPIVIDGTTLGAPVSKTAKAAAVTEPRDVVPRVATRAVAPPYRAPSASAATLVVPPETAAKLGARKAPEPAPGSQQKPWAALDGSGKSGGAWREPAAAGPSAAKRTLLGGLEAPMSVPRPASVPRPSQPSAAAPTASKPPSAVKRTMLGIAPPPEPAPTDASELEPEWTVALTDDQHEEMRTQEVVELYARGSIDHETFIWADGMEDWKQPWEIPMIAAALLERRLSRPSDDEIVPEADEPDEDDATIVASVRFSMPSSRRGSVPSGVWREPGRDQEDEEEEKIGFDDVTVSLDGAKAQKLLGSYSGRAPAAKSEPPPFEDEVTRVADFERGPEGGRLGAGVDDLLAGMDDPTGAMGPFHAVARPLHSVPDFDEEDTTIEQSHAPQAAMPLPPPVAPYAPPPIMQAPDAGLFADLDVPSMGGRAEPLDSLLGPAQPHAAQYPQYGPASLPGPKPKKSRALGCLFVLFVLFAALAGAGAASYYYQQPAQLYGPDGRPKLPFAL